MIGCIVRQSVCQTRVHTYKHTHAAKLELTRENRSSFRGAVGIALFRWRPLTLMMKVAAVQVTAPSPSLRHYSVHVRVNQMLEHVMLL